MKLKLFFPIKYLESFAVKIDLIMLIPTRIMQLLSKTAQFYLI